jgi:integrase
MTLDDVDLDQRIVWVLGKGRRPWALPVGRKTAQALDRYLRAREGHRLAHLPHLWVGRNGPMTPSGVYQVVHDRARAAGLPPMHPHQLRHAFATSWLAEGGNENELMLVAGWKSRIMDFPPWGLCWRIHTGEGTGRSLVRREVQLPVVTAPVSQASTRTRLRASAVSTCCRWVLGRPR